MSFGVGYINRIPWKIKWNQPGVPAYEFVDLVTGGYMIISAGESMYRAIDKKDISQNDNSIFRQNASDDQYFKFIRAASYEHSSYISKGKNEKSLIGLTATLELYAYPPYWGYDYSKNTLFAHILITTDESKNLEQYLNMDGGRENDYGMYDFDVALVCEYLKTRYSQYVNDFDDSLSKYIISKSKD